MAMDRLKNLLECSVCLDRYEDPKLLSCGHHFCRKCIEDLVVVNKIDGAGHISCPLRCDAKTTITRDQTVSDLVPSYDFKNIIETLQKDSKEVQASQRRCQKDKECNGNVSVSCCEILMCCKCHKKHVKNKGHRANQKHRKDVPVGFSCRRNNFQIWCKKHNSGCSHVCFDDAFLCHYCVHRNEDYKDHVKEPIDAVVTLLREAMLNEVRKIEQMVAFFDATQAYWLIEQEKNNELVQKLIQLNLVLNGKAHSERMDKEKLSALLNRSYHDVLREHLQQYGKIKEFPSNYYKIQLKRCDIAVILEKASILKRICENPVPATLMSAIVCFSHSSLPEDMFGNFVVRHVEEISVDDQVVSTLTFDVKGITEEIQKMKVCVSNSFEDLQEERMIPALDGCAARSILQRAKSSSGSMKVKSKKRKRGRAGKYSDNEGIYFQEDESGNLLSTAPGMLSMRMGVNPEHYTSTMVNCFGIVCETCGSCGESLVCEICGKNTEEIFFMSTVQNKNPLKLFLHYVSSCCGRNLPTDGFPVIEHYRMSHKMIHMNKMLYRHYQIVAKKSQVKSIHGLCQSVLQWQWLTQWKQQWVKCGLALLSSMILSWIYIVMIL